MNVRITKVTMDRWPNKEDLDKYKSSKKILDVNFCVDIDELISSSNVTDKSQSAKLGWTPPMHGCTNFQGHYGYNWPNIHA